MRRVMVFMPPPGESATHAYCALHPVPPPIPKLCKIKFIDFTGIMRIERITGQQPATAQWALLCGREIFREMLWRVGDSVIRSFSHHAFPHRIPHKQANPVQTPGRTVPFDGKSRENGVRLLWQPPNCDGISAYKANFQEHTFQHTSKYTSFFRWCTILSL